MCSLQAALLEYMMDRSLTQDRGEVRNALVYDITAATKLFSLNKSLPSDLRACAFSFNSYKI